MKVILIGEKKRYRDLLEIFQSNRVEIHFLETPEFLPNEKGYAAIFDFRTTIITELTAYQATPEIPVFISLVGSSLPEIDAPSNIIRVNGWPGFIRKPELELAGGERIRPVAEDMLASIGFKAHWVKDVPGMVSPRVVAMIINEAYFAWEEGVSTKNEIDLAMKLGTNYPFGPFEWGRLIGIDQVMELLKKLEAEDPVYCPAASLVKEAGMNQ